MELTCNDCSSQDWCKYKDLDTPCKKFVDMNHCPNEYGLSEFGFDCNTGNYCDQCWHLSIGLTKFGIESFDLEDRIKKLKELLKEKESETLQFNLYNLAWMVYQIYYHDYEVTDVLYENDFTVEEAYIILDRQIKKIEKELI